jgi:hypothetical protein
LCGACQFLGQPTEVAGRVTLVEQHQDAELPAGVDAERPFVARVDDCRP